MYDASIMSLDHWEIYFKPEVRKGGRTLASKGVVNLTTSSDTEVHCYIRGSSPVKVSFRSDSIESPNFTAACTCASSKKGQFCKHMWAALTEVAEKKPDFLDSKTEMELYSQAKDLSTAGSPKTTGKSDSQLAYKAKREEFEAQQKEKQSDYRKQLYQKQKEKLRSSKGKPPKSKTFVQQFPEDVEAALVYFSQNGFELREDLNSQAVSLARKQLARVFHPDKGGNHDEILELNAHADVLLDFSEQ